MMVMMTMMVVIMMTMVWMMIDGINNDVVPMEQHRPVAWPSDYLVRDPVEPQTFLQTFMTYSSNGVNF